MCVCVAVHTRVHESEGRAMHAFLSPYEIFNFVRTPLTSSEGSVRSQ